MSPFPYDARGAVERVRAHNGKWTPNEVTDNLRHLAIDYLLSLPKPIDFAFLSELRVRIDNGLTLTDAQYAGVLNCAAREWSRVKVKDPVVEEGIYREPTTERIFKVQRSRQSRGLYAKKLVVDRRSILDEDGTVREPAVVRFVYEPSAIYSLTPDMRLTKEQAKEFGAWSGTCVSCGRHLTADDSIDRMMGPVCYKRQFKEVPF